MSDLTDEELGQLAVTAGWLQNKSPVAQLQHSDEVRLGRRIDSVVAELQRHRAAQAASKERLRCVVEASTLALLTERNLYIVKPYQPTMGEIALEAYGHGRACDAAALLGDDLRAVLAAIATRVAEQLATPAVLSAEERAAILGIRDLVRNAPPADDDRTRDVQLALLDRLVGAKP